MVRIKHESMRKEQTSHKNEHNTLMCFPLEPVFTRDKRRLPNFIDEPTAGLDVMARESILNLFREYMEEDGERTILISSHISSDLEGLCDDIYMIHEGRIIFHEDTDVLLNQYGLLKVDEKQFEELDKRYLLKKRKEHYGYACLTKEKQYYIENYPDIVVEKGTVDELIAMMIGGNEL